MPEKMFICDACGLGFPTNKNLSAHYEQCHGSPIPCDDCGGVYQSKLDLLNHHIQAHKNENTCKECGKKYKHQSSLWNHFKAVHEDQKVACHLCNDVFAPRALKTHIKRCMLKQNRYNILQNETDIFMEDLDDPSVLEEIPDEATIKKISSKKAKPWMCSALKLVKTF